MEIYTFAAFGYCALWGVLGLHHASAAVSHRRDAATRLLLRLILVSGLAATLPVLETGRTSMTRAVTVVITLGVGAGVAFYRAVCADARRVGISPTLLLCVAAGAVLAVFALP